MREVGLRTHGAARESPRTWNGVMSTAKMVGRGWSCTSDGTGVIIYSILMAFLMLSWAYIPAERYPATFRGAMPAKIRFGGCRPTAAAEISKGEGSSQPGKIVAWFGARSVAEPGRQVA